MASGKSTIARGWYLLRSLAFYAGYALSVILYSVFVLAPASILPYSRRYHLLNGWNRLALHWARIACGIRYRVSGLENLPDGACVVIANHQSSWETILLPTLFPQLCTLLKRELLNIPFFGWSLKLLRPIAIDRDNPRAALRQMLEQGTERIQDGCSVLIFPQGTRVDPGLPLRFARGAAQLAIRSGADIVCVAHDAGRCWPPRRMVKTPGIVNVAVSPPFSTAGGDAAELTERARSWIQQQLDAFQSG
jgi:1-acyl-sn-glycerol-3-phosphate acyltransferase